MRDSGAPPRVVHLADDRQCGPRPFPCAGRPSPVDQIWTASRPDDRFSIRAARGGGRIRCLSADRQGPSTFGRWSLDPCLDHIPAVGRNVGLEGVEERSSRFHSASADLSFQGQCLCTVDQEGVPVRQLVMDELSGHLVEEELADADLLLPVRG